MSQFRDNAAKFERLGTQLIGISVDSFFSHADFADHLKLGFPLLSDFNRKVVPFFTGYYDDLAGLKGVGRRRVLVVDRDGVIRYNWSTPDPAILPDVEEVLRAVDALGLGARKQAEGSGG